MTREQEIAAYLMELRLNECDGAALYWQLPEDGVKAIIASGRAYIAADDCLVLRTATRIGEGAYTLKQH